MFWRRQQQPTTRGIYLAIAELVVLYIRVSSAHAYVRRRLRNLPNRIPHIFISPIVSYQNDYELLSVAQEISVAKTFLELGRTQRIETNRDFDFDAPFICAIFLFNLLDTSFSFR